MQTVQRGLLSLVLLFCATNVTADDRTAKIHALMEAQGLVEMFDAQMQYGRVHGGEQANQMLDQLLTGLDPPSEFQERFNAAVTAFMKDVQAPWTAQDIVDEWGRAYGKHFTDDELDTIGFLHITAGQEGRGREQGLDA
jgi:hypothetical protein